MMTYTEALAAAYISFPGVRITGIYYTTERTGWVAHIETVDGRRSWYEPIPAVRDTGTIRSFSDLAIERRFDNGGWEGADDDDPRYQSDPDF